METSKYFCFLTLSNWYIIVLDQIFIFRINFHFYYLRFQISDTVSIQTQTLFIYCWKLHDEKKNGKDKTSIIKQQSLVFKKQALHNYIILSGIVKDYFAAMENEKLPKTELWGIVL